MATQPKPEIALRPAWGLPLSATPQGPKPKRHITGARALSVAGLAQAPWFKVLARVLTVTGTVHNAGGPAGWRWMLLGNVV